MRIVKNLQFINDNNRKNIFGSAFKKRCFEDIVIKVSGAIFAIANLCEKVIFLCFFEESQCFQR